MALNVDLGELVAVAARAADMARTTGAALPREWVLPAGADPISAQAVPRLNAQAAGLFNGVLGVLNEVQKLSHNVGTAAVEYATADTDGARTIGSGETTDAANPVPQIEQVGYRRVPESLSNMTSVTGDPLIFAQQLHSGPGPGPAHRFANSVRAFTAENVTTARGDMDDAASTMQHWTPVGSDVAEKITKYRGWLDELGNGLTLLADSADSYGGSFANAKAKHPTPEEIIAARKKLVRAMRSKDEIGTQAALAEFQEQNARSAETIGNYSAETGVATGTAEQAGAGTGQGGDSSALMQMMPALMSMMSTGMNGLPLTEEISDDYYDDYYDDYGLGDLGIPSGSPGGGVPSLPGVPSPAEVESVTVGPMPMTTAVGLGSSSGLASAPRVPVMESASPSSSSSAPYGRSGMPYMPMMPMSPGAGGGGANGNERNRVVAWHPDRLMYVDDTPHTEQVIGERPTIAPTVTSPTPPPPNQAPTRSGGSA